MNSYQITKTVSCTLYDKQRAITQNSNAHLGIEYVGCVMLRYVM